MSISDGLAPSIFCREMEKRNLGEKGWIEELLISRQIRHSNFDAVIYKSSFPYLYLELACEQFFSGQEKV